MAAMHVMEQAFLRNGYEEDVPGWGWRKGCLGEKSFWAVSLPLSFALGIGAPSEGGWQCWVQGLAA